MITLANFEAKGIKFEFHFSQSPMWTARSYAIYFAVFSPDMTEDDASCANTCVNTNPTLETTSHPYRHNIQSLLLVNEWKIIKYIRQFSQLFVKTDPEKIESKLTIAERQYCGEKFSSRSEHELVSLYKTINHQLYFNWTGSVTRNY